MSKLWLNTKGELFATQYIVTGIIQCGELLTTPVLCLIFSRAGSGRHGRRFLFDESVQRDTVWGVSHGEWPSTLLVSGDVRENREAGLRQRRPKLRQPVPPATANLSHTSAAPYPISGHMWSVRFVNTLRVCKHFDISDKTDNSSEEIISIQFYSIRTFKLIFWLDWIFWFKVVLCQIYWDGKSRFSVRLTHVSIGLD